MGRGRPPVALICTPAALLMAVGVDGCRNGWVWVSLTRGGATVGTSASLAEVFDRFPRVRVLIDMPIGLPSDTQPRGCESLARRFIGPRRSSVFTPPARIVLGASDYASANAENRRATGRGLSKQAWHLVPRIREADDLLRRTPSLNARVFESHPEVCFRALAGRPLRHYKKTGPGAAERLALLESRFPGGGERVRALHRDLDRRAAADDVIDAAVLAVTAVLPRAGLACFPGAPEFDAAGLPMRMVLPRPATLDPVDRSSIGALP